MSENAYEQFRNRLLLELDAEGNMSDMELQRIAAALDRTAYGFEITAKETALAISTDIIPAMVRTYIAVKKTEGRTRETLTNYLYVLRRFFMWCKKQPAEVTTNDIRMFLYYYQEEKGVSDRTLDKYREIICWFFSWAHEEEYLSKNPAKSVKPIKYEIKERQALSQIELEYMRQACKTPRDKAILEFLYSTGCRVSELCGVKLSDVNWDNNSVHLFGKGRKHRTSYLNAKAVVALKGYLEMRNDNCEYLFVTERRPFKQVAKDSIERKIGIITANAQIPKHVTPHILRHTTATTAVNNGMNIEEVSKLLGHANVATTMVYAKVSTDNVQAAHTHSVI